MRIRFIFSLCCFFILSSLFSQSLRDRLGRGLINPDSADVIFTKEKENLNTESDFGVYAYFIGENYYRESEYDSARKYFLESVNKTDREKEPALVSMSYISLARINSYTGDWEQALFNSQEGYNHARVVSDTNYMAFSLFDISVVYHDMEQYEKGVTYGKEALELLNQYPKAKPLFKAYALNAIAINFDDWDKPDSALYYHYQVLDDIENLDSMAIGQTFNNIGNTLLKQKKYSEAKKWINTSLGLNYKSKSDRRIATNYTNLATISYSLENYIEADQMLDSAAKYVELSQSTEKKRDYLQEQYRYNKKRGRLPLAIEYLEQYATLKDSIFKTERVELMADLEAKYKVESKERELAESRAALAENELLVKNRNNQLLLMLILSLVLFGIGFFIYYRQRAKNRHLEQEAKLQVIYSEQETQKKLNEQRNRISADLHDNIGAQLTFIVSSLDNLKFVNLTKDKLASKIDKISSFTVDTVNELRDTIWAMNKENISVEDLQIRLTSFIVKAKEACPKISFDLQVDDDLEKDYLLNSMEGVNYYRIAQEAINNAIKHSNAGIISIHFSKEKDSIRIRISDNGIGIKENNMGNGLGNMRNRAERIGKQFEIKSEENSGTEVFVW